MEADLFDGIEDAQVSGGGIYFLVGNYRVEILKVFTLVSRKKEDMVIVECKIHSSTNPARPAGSRASWVVNFKQDAALGNIKGFAQSCAKTNLPKPAPGEPEPVITKADMAFIVSKDNPLAGTVLDLQCTNIETRAKSEFTLHTWLPIFTDAAPAA
jgi:hypothetical protein